MLALWADERRCLAFSHGISSVPARFLFKGAKVGTSSGMSQAGTNGPEHQDVAQGDISLEAMGLNPETTPPDVLRAIDTLRRIQNGERFSPEEVSAVQQIMANETLAMQALTRLQRGLDVRHSSIDPD